ncbi:alternative ribosome rescue aminoacyl-tRNA hydrolase ArfB [Flavobacterium sp. ASW18X]|uniref:alternative ribosome rescue aminoacyl-tRNA hydrolase ArfB n=1 Tax=Flavobacterium sp. ASW18X TaxID=2572595 RepID=UPI0010ADE681|nr:alternative ribosome rescue aminoacyl-tRNA hydrolase ArfB [Flavobacterium sp. ASW18X]TKD65190.1 aminoacyl-tRNA hydrolase [Flavobacterium sp. ASW18X]
MLKTIILKELQYKAARSSGAGGQNVNKVATKVEVYFNIMESQGLSEVEKERIISKLGPKLSKENILILQAEDTRSQHKNKEIVTAKLFTLLQGALYIPKKRKATRPTRAAKEKRINSKKKTAWKKELRKRPNIE